MVLTSGVCAVVSFQRRRDRNNHPEIHKLSYLREMRAVPGRQAIVLRVNPLL